MTLADHRCLAPAWPNTSFRADLPGSANTSASWVGAFHDAGAGTIHAGTSQIQRNIVGEMVLGLPKEPRPARLSVGLVDRPRRVH